MKPRHSALSTIRRRSVACSYRTVRQISSHSSRIALLDQSLEQNPSFSYTYPRNSPIINERHFYQNTVLVDWCQKAPRPISLRQLAFFGRRLTPEKILSSTNFVRIELPVRLAHRIRDMQRLPFALISNEYLCAVYEQYYKAFDRFRKFPQVNTLEENDQFCEMLTELLEEHLSVIPKLVMGAIECSQQEIIDSERLDTFMSSMLRSRISRRVIAEQHLSLTNTFKAGKRNTDLDPDYIGEVFLQCKAGDVVENASKHAIDQIQEMYPDSEMPEVIIEGASDATFPYIKSHLDYIVGEILRNSVEATVTMFHKNKHMYRHPPPILVSIASSPQHVFIRFSDQGGGIDPEILKHIWSFAKGPGSAGRLQTFREVHTLAGLSTEVKTHSERSKPITVDIFPGQEVPHKGSLEPLTTRLPNVKLGMGLPLSKVYAEYWDGALEVHSLDGYGTDVFFKISCLGNQAERLQLDRV